MAKSRRDYLGDSWGASLALGLVLLALAYGFGSWAINSGSMWAYLLTIVSFIWAIRRLVKGVKYAFEH